MKYKTGGKGIKAWLNLTVGGYQNEGDVEEKQSQMTELLVDSSHGFEIENFGKSYSLTEEFRERQCNS